MLCCCCHFSGGGSHGGHGWHGRYLVGHVGLNAVNAGPLRLMVAAVEGCLDEVGGDDALALDVDVAADVAVVSGGHQYCRSLIGDLEIEWLKLQCMLKLDIFYKI